MLTQQSFCRLWIIIHFHIRYVSTVWWFVPSFGRGWQFSLLQLWLLPPTLWIPCSIWITTHAFDCAAIFNNLCKCIKFNRTGHLNFSVGSGNFSSTRHLSSGVWSLTDNIAGPQMPVQPVQPVPAAGPDHSKPLEKPELYSSLFQGPDQTKGMSSTSTPSTQVYPQANNFNAGRPNDAYR